jgi:chromate reductase
MTMDRDTITVGAVAGSLRRRSFNRALLRAAIELAPPGMTIRTFERLGEIPPYDADVEDAGIPAIVEQWKDFIGGADAVLVVTPEYNYGVPGVLKNAIDWASRPPTSSPLAGKPAGIMGASRGSSGTIRAQLHLRQNFIFTQTLVMLRPEVYIQRAAEKFDADLRLSDEKTREVVATFLAALAAWTRRIGPPGDANEAP